MSIVKNICFVNILFLVPIAGAFAGTHSLTTGLAISYDQQERQYDAAVIDDDDYQRIRITPSLQYIFSANAHDTLEIRLAPSLSYDVEDGETDWEYNDFLVSFQKAISRNWRVDGSNSFLRTDDQDSQSDRSDDVDVPVSNTDAPTLSNDPGRTKYWRNNLQLGTDYTYREASLVHFGLGYNVLRNDDSENESYDDYDRYVFNIRNEHRYNVKWSTVVDLSFVRGEYEETDLEAAQGVVDAIAPALDLEVTQEALSQDVNEYRLTASLENHSFRQNVISISYDFIASEYDDVLQDDSNVHQAQLTWQRQYSPHLSTTLGAGPSYEKTDGLDANYGGNGIAAVDYQMQRSSVSFQVEKRYDVENFSGTDDRGFVDLWDATLTANYELARDLTIDCRLSYRFEIREEPALNIDGEVAEGNLINLEEYDTDIYRVGVGLNYNFLRYYSVSLNYTFTEQESDRQDKVYDDHRILLTLSWEQEWLRW